MCDRCRADSGVLDRPATAVLAGERLLYVGAYRHREARPRDVHEAEMPGRSAPPHAGSLSPLGAALRAFKDRGDRYAGRCLAAMFADRCAPSLAAIDLVVPVPSDPERLRRRGLSPSAWLARMLAARADVPLSMTSLVRVPGRPPQRALGGRARRANACGAFRLGVERLQGYSVALVDDVATTGATLHHAAERLREGGAAAIVCAVLACADEEVLAECPSTIANAGPSVIATRAG